MSEQTNQQTETARALAALETWGIIQQHLEELRACVQDHVPMSRGEDTARLGQEIIEAMRHGSGADNETWEHGYQHGLGIAFRIVMDRAPDESDFDTASANTQSESTR